MKVRYSIIVLSFILSLLSCKERGQDNIMNSAKAIIRFGGRYYSINAFESGVLFVTKGKCSNSIEPFKAFTAQNSKIVKSDVVNTFYRKIAILQQKPIIIRSNISDSPRVEIFFKGKKVYDAYFSDGPFWEYVSSIETILPSGYNPFLTDEHPFD